jgi:DNA-binding CsgD family transcriptional regulator
VSLIARLARLLNARHCFETTRKTYRSLDISGWGTARRGFVGDALLHVPRKGRLPLSILVIPTSPSRTSWVSGDPTYVLLVFDPERQLAMNEQLLATDLGLTDRESQVVALLAGGLQIEQIAQHLQVTVHTVRSQLKAAFHKTGCHTQAQLVKRLLLGPGSATRI